MAHPYDGELETYLAITGMPQRSECAAGSFPSREQALRKIQSVAVLDIVDPRSRCPAYGLPDPRRLGVFRLLIAVFALSAATSAQESAPPPPTEVHEHVAGTASLLTPPHETSGTGWLPTATPITGVHRPWGDWDLRLNAGLFIQAVYEPSERHRTGGFSTRQGSSVNWGMFMARRRLGAGRFGVRSMVSAEPWTVPGCGSLNFLATGEVCEDDTIHDRQQPHDLFMELAADYERPFVEAWRWQIYAGLAGEPALGPPGYPHRASAVPNPTRPVTHHWLDSTHVTFGLVTIGMHNQRWKAELSAFHGREPDERRIDLDLGAFDSVAGRLSFLPTERLALQVSAARLREARTDFPFPAQDPVVRATASAMHHAPLGGGGLWATTLAVGVNHARERVAAGTLDATTVGALLESTVTISGRHSLFGRGEVGGMPAHHLHVHDFATSVFAVGKVQIGYVRHVRAMKGMVPGIGGTMSVSLLSPELAPRRASASSSVSRLPHTRCSLAHAQRSPGESAADAILALNALGSVSSDRPYRRLDSAGPGGPRFRCAEPLCARARARRRDCGHGCHRPARRQAVTANPYRRLFLLLPLR